MKKWHVILAAALAMGTMTALTGCGSTEVDLNQYVSLECEGYDSAGTATYTIDWEGLVDDNRKAFDLEEDASKKSVKRVARKLEDKISGELDETENLSNGDTVTFQWDKIDTDKLEERYPVKLSYSDVKLEVKGLDEPEDFNPFDYLTVSYEGEAPHGYVYLETDSDIPYYVSFEADQSDNLRNGDKIKVTVSSYMDEDLEEECLASGLKLTETEKTYTVEGLESYVQKLDEIPEDIMARMTAKAQEKYGQIVADNWNDPTSYKGITFVGNYLLTPKDTEDYTFYENSLYFVFKISAEANETKEKFDYYWCANFNDLLLKDDGTCEVDMDYFSTTWNTFEKNNLYYDGYATLDELYANEITEQSDEYNCESNVQ